MAQPAGRFAIQVSHVGGYEFRVRFDKASMGEVVLDEPPPLGADHGPNPARLLAASVGTCLAASLLFCLGKARATVSDLVSDVGVELVRNESRRLRIGRVDVTLRPVVSDARALDACLQGFEDFCVVTQSVREGLDVRVRVEPSVVEHRLDDGAAVLVQ